MTLFFFLTESVEEKKIKIINSKHTFYFIETKTLDRYKSYGKIRGKVYVQKIYKYNYLNNGLYKSIFNNIPLEWVSFFADFEFEIFKLSQVLENITDNIYPKCEDVFRIFHLLKPKNIKCLVIGQDPYPSEIADGIAFSSRGKEIPPSLKNIYNELENEEFNYEKDANLEKWVEKGIFLINAALTVSENSDHNKLWSNFTDKLLRWISTKTTFKIPVLMMGLKSQQYRFIFEEKQWFLCAHPSPFSADKGFYGSDIFKKINQYLLKNNENIIW